MLIEARIENAHSQHHASLTTNGIGHELTIGTQTSGFGSRVNGGELLCLALATCYCNDLYREGRNLGIDIVRIVVHASAEFGAPGEAARALRYRADVTARAAEDAIRQLMAHTDRVAEVQNTLRRGIGVAFDIGDVRRAEA